MERLIVIPAQIYHDYYRWYSAALDPNGRLLVIMPDKYYTGRTASFCNLVDHISHIFEVPGASEPYRAISFTQPRFLMSPHYRVVTRPDLREVNYGPIADAMYAPNGSYPSVYSAPKIFESPSNVVEDEIDRTRTASTIRYQRTATVILDALMASLRFTCTDCDAVITSIQSIVNQQRDRLCCDACRLKYSCKNCGRGHGTSVHCKRCKRCDYCCRCRRCPCGGPKVYTREVVCGICSTCAIHKCKCRFPRQFPEQRLKGVDVAFEFEFGTNANDRPPRAQTVRDLFHPASTMTDTSCPAGFELVSGPMPLHSTNDKVGACELTEEVVGWCNRKGYTCLSDSTSYHVHVNAVDLSLHQLRKLFVTWCAFEDEIYTEFIANHRRTNTYAQMMTSYIGLPGFLGLLRKAKAPQDIRKLMLLFMYTNYSTDRMDEIVFRYTAQQQKEHGHPLFKNLRQYQHEKYATGRYVTRSGTYGAISSRYTTLNLHSFFYRGTLEFRGKEVNLEPGNLTRWLVFCHNFVKVIRALPESEHIKSFQQLMELTNKESN